MLTLRPLYAIAILFFLAAPTQAQMPAPEVDVATPLVKEVTEYYEYTGRFQAINEVELRARVSGYLQEIRFKDGQEIKKGDVLFVIDKRPYVAAVSQAKATLKKAQSELELTKLDLARGESLLKSNNISTDEVDKRRADVAGAEATVEHARAALEAAMLDLEFTEITAPFDGHVSDRKVDEGTFISGGNAQSTALTTIVSTGPVHFYFDAPEADYLHFTRLDRAGQRVSARYENKPVEAQLSDEDGWPHKGTLDFVDVRIDPNSGTIRAHALFANEEDILLPGYFGRLRLPARGPHTVMLLPDSAIISDQSSKLVYVMGENNMATLRPVTLGPVIDGMRIIRSGVSEDDRVIVRGGVRVRPGMPLHVTETTLTSE